MERPSAETIHQARVNAGRMLRARGYGLDEGVYRITLDEFRARLDAREDLDLYAEADDMEPIYVRFLHSQVSKLSKALLDNHVNLVAQRVTGDDGAKYDGTPRILLVCEESPASATEAELRMPKYRNVEVWRYDALLLDPTAHELVPPHELVPVEEEEALLDRYSCSRKNVTREFPRLLSNDPVARWYGFRAGRLVKVTRPSEQAGTEVVFRVVV